jgi:hypothetical protein
MNARRRDIVKQPLADAIAAFSAKHLACCVGVSGETIATGLSFDVTADAVPRLVFTARCTVCGGVERAQMIEIEAEREVEAATGLPFLESMALLKQDGPEWGRRYSEGVGLLRRIDRLARQESRQAN